VRRSADRSKITDGRTAPRETASSSPKSVSAETITSPFAAAYSKDGLISSGEQPDVGDMDGLETRAAQRGDDSGREVRINEEPHGAYAG
jgi:hypothetical protein